MKKKSLVLIGANGLIGRSFVDQYSNKYEIIKCLRKDDLSKVLEKHKPSIIFNSSGEPYDKKKMFFTNVLIVKKIIDYCTNNKSFLVDCKSFIFLMISVERRSVKASKLGAKSRK